MWENIKDGCSVFFGGLFGLCVAGGIIYLLIINAPRFLLFSSTTGILIGLSYTIKGNSKNIHESFIGVAIAISIILGIIACIIGADTGCADGRISSSIGKQGACSWHGGVESSLNDIGIIILVVVLLVGIGIILSSIWKDYTENRRYKKEEKKKEKLRIQKWEEEKTERKKIEEESRYFNS